MFYFYYSDFRCSEFSNYNLYVPIVCMYIECVLLSLKQTISMSICYNFIFSSSFSFFPSISSSAKNVKIKFANNNKNRRWHYFHFSKIQIFSNGRTNKYLVFVLRQRLNLGLNKFTRSSLI